MAIESLFEAEAAHVALVVFAAGVTDDPLVEKARAAGSFIITVECIANDASPWHADNLPGAAEGCGHWPGVQPRHVRIRSDRNGLYFVSIADLLLRSNNVRALAFAGPVPDVFAQNVTLFARRNGYRLVGNEAADPQSA